MSINFEFDQICVATDFSETSERAVRYAIGLAEKFGARLHLLHVLHDMTLVLDHPDFTTSGETVHDFLAELEADAAGRLETLTANSSWKMVDVTRAIRHGAVSQEICRYADRQNIDLLILGTHGRTGLKHMFLGSVAERVVRAAPCPVLTVRHPSHRVTRLVDEPQSSSNRLTVGEGSPPTEEQLSLVYHHASPGGGTMTEIPTTAASPETILAEHQELLLSIEKLHDAWSEIDSRTLASSPDRVAGLRSLVERLRDDLAAHFTAEERGGYMGHVLSIAPAFTGQATQLGGQHRDFLRTLDRIAESLGQQHVSADSLQAARQAFGRFVDRLLEHEHAENEIVQSAFTTDIGSGD